MNPSNYTHALFYKAVVYTSSLQLVDNKAKALSLILSCKTQYY